MSRILAHTRFIRKSFLACAFTRQTNTALRCTAGNLRCEAAVYLNGGREVWHEGGYLLRKRSVGRGLVEWVGCGKAEMGTSASGSLLLEQRLVRKQSADRGGQAEREPAAPTAEAPRPNLPSAAGTGQA